MLLVVVDRLSYPLLCDHAGPALRTMMENGAVALMNVRSAGSGSESGYLTLGAGARAVAGSEGGQAFQRGEIFEGQQAEILFMRHTGRAPDGAVFHLHMPTLYRRNRSLGYRVLPGYLGGYLAGHGKVAAVAGNADGGIGNPVRNAVLIAMDREGTVPLGLVGDEVLERTPFAPFGCRASLDVLVEAAVSLLEKAHFIVIDFGDINRLDRYWLNLDENRRDMLLADTVARLDRLVGSLLFQCNGQVMFLLVVPSPPANLPGGEEALVPFVMTGGGCPGGLAESANTRRPGLVAGADLVALTAAFLVEGNRPGDACFPIGVVASPDAPARLDYFFTRAVRLYRQRPPILKGFVMLVIITIVASLAGLALRLTLAEHLAAALEALVLVPPALLLLAAWPAYPFSSAALSGVTLAVTTLVLALFLGRLKKVAGAPVFWALFGLAGAGLILIDGLNGSPLQQYSFLGYDIIGGSRYYGTGNEYMGTLIGAALTGSTALAGMAAGPNGAFPAGIATRPPADEPRSALPLRAVWVFSLVLYIIIVLYLASPRFGANLGGTVAAAVAFAVAAAGVRSALHGPDLKRSLRIAFPAGLGLAVLFLWLFNFSPLAAGAASHLGRFGLSLRERGLDVLWETVIRKASMNWKLVRYSIWSRALVSFLALLVFLCFYPIGLLRRLGREQPYLLVGAAAGAAGGVAALLANDSGVVAAAMILLFTVPPLLSAMITLALRELHPAAAMRQE